MLWYLLEGRGLHRGVRSLLGRSPGEVTLVLLALQVEEQGGKEERRRRGGEGGEEEERELKRRRGR